MIRHSVFAGEAGMSEVFFAGESSPGASFAEELTALMREYETKCADAGCSPETEILLRFHVSDPANQQPELKKQLAGRKGGFVSTVGQRPVSGARVSLEALHWQGVNETHKQRTRNALTVTLKDGVLAVLHSLAEIPQGTSAAHTGAEFEALSNYLMQHGGRVAKSTVRTWLYCRDVDNQYPGLVKARNVFFERAGLRRDTRYIASTGIEGKMSDPHRLVKMDSLSIVGLNSRHQRPVTANDMLSPTHLYGVAFERGMQVFWSDREWCFISGTASIDKDGKIVHPGDVEKQTGRMLENIATLLANAGVAWPDVKTAVVYLRDPSDAGIVRAALAKTLPADLPLLMLEAPVCRPGWLVEMECFAERTRRRSDGLEFQV